MFSAPSSPSVTVALTSDQITTTITKGPGNVNLYDIQLQEKDGSDWSNIATNVVGANHPAYTVHYKFNTTLSPGSSYRVNVKSVSTVDLESAPAASLNEVNIRK